MAESNEDASLYSSRHQSALELDLSLFRLTLSRNRAGHGRTRYHRHMLMTLKCWDRNRIDQLHADWTSFVSEWEKWRTDLLVQTNQMQKKRKREEVFWELTPAIRPSDKVGNSGSDRITIEEPNKRIVNLLDGLMKRTLSGWSEVDSRMSLAVKTITQEISRGFFLPYLSVAIGAMARMRALALRCRMDLAKRILPLLLIPLQDSSPISTTDDLFKSLQRISSVIQREDGANTEKMTGKMKKRLLVDTQLRRLGFSGSSSKSQTSRCPDEINTKAPDQPPDSPAPLLETGKPIDETTWDVGESIGSATGNAIVPHDKEEPDYHQRFIESLQRDDKKSKDKKKKKKRRGEKESKKKADFFDSLFER